MISIPPELARSALDGAPDAIVIVDEGGIIRFANRQVAALFGYARDEIIGKGVEVLLPERFREHHLAHRERYFLDGRVRKMGAGLALIASREDGSEFPVEINLSRIGADDRPLIAAAIRDATDRKRAEDELKAVRDAAERASRSKSRFLATASHDLRQPLQALALLNGMLRRLVTDPEAAAALEQQDRAFGAMSRLLNTLLDISKIDSGAIKAEPEDFELGELFEELRREFAGLAQSKGLRLDIEPCLHWVRSDPALLGQILRNLISNAIKYTRDGRVCLRCLCNAVPIRIEVQDTGVGIPADQLSHICDEFYQVGVPANSSGDGYGLGLNIVQRLVNLLKLKLDVHSDVGSGSTFSLSLPESDGPAGLVHAGSSERPTPRRQVGNARVLLVEDDAGVRRATRMLLAVEGYSVTAVATLAEALQHVRAGNGLDLLISDYHLAGGETGIQVISALREALGVPLKAVITTGDTSAAIRELPRDPDLRIASKPMQADEFMALLRALLAA